MGILLRIAEWYVPGIARQAEFDRLFRATAAAFQVCAPATNGLGYEDRLRLYAAFTKDQAEGCLRRGETESLKARLFENACRLGEDYRVRFGLSSAEEVMRIGRVVYRQLGIDFRGEPGGNVLISRCFFSQYYSADICRLVSSLDQGLLAGLSRGSCLRFSQRITEGALYCRGYLDAKVF